MIVGSVLHSMVCSAVLQRAVLCLLACAACALCAAELRRCSALRELHLEYNRLATPLLDLTHASALESLQVPWAGQRSFCQPNTMTRITPMANTAH